MRERTSIIIQRSDAKFIAQCKAFGIRELARETRISPSMISRWLIGHTGMDMSKYTRIKRAVEGRR